MTTKKVSYKSIPIEYEIIEKSKIPFKNYNTVKCDMYDYECSIAYEMECDPPIYEYEYGRKKLEQPRNEEIIFEYPKDDSYE